MPNVTLNVTLKDGHLDVNQKGNPHHIPHVDTEITWHLQLTHGRDGSFNPLDHKDGPGFHWREVPPDGIFEKAIVEVADKKIKLGDHNTNPHGVNSVGEWIYELRATIDGKPYSTITECLEPSLVTDVQHDPEARMPTPPQPENDMARNRDDQNPPSNTPPEDEEQEGLTATEPDESSTLSGTPSPRVIVNPRIKNN